MDALGRFCSVRSNLSTLSEHNFDFRYPEISRMFRILDTLDCSKPAPCPWKWFCSACIRNADFFLSDRKAVAMICFFVLFCFVLFVCLFEFFSKHLSVLFISLNRQRFPYCFLTSSPLAYIGLSSLCSFSW